MPELIKVINIRENHRNQVSSWALINPKRQEQEARRTHYQSSWWLSLSDIKRRKPIQRTLVAPQLGDNRTPTIKTWCICLNNSQVMLLLSKSSNLLKWRLIRALKTYCVKNKQHQRHQRSPNTHLEVTSLPQINISGSNKQTLVIVSEVRREICTRQCSSRSTKLRKPSGRLNPAQRCLIKKRSPYRAFSESSVL